MPVRYKGGGGGGGSGDADIIWTENPRLRDAPAVNPKLPDQLVTREVHRQSPLALHSTPRLTSRRIVPDLSAAHPEALRSPDFLTGSVEDIRVNRSGTPDADMAGDGWTDGLLANNAVNHGNESPLQVASQDIIATTKRGYLKWDLRRFANLDAPAGSTMTLKLFTDHAVAVLVAYTVTFSNKAATNPFTESTLNWTNQPADGTDVVSKAASALVRLDILTSQYQASNTVLTAAEYEPFLGNWMMVRLTSNALIATPLNVASREHNEGAAPGGLRPRLSFSFEQD